MNASPRSKGLHTAYLKGWDHAVAYGSISENPYHRSDYRGRWDSGFKDCEGLAVNTRPGFQHYKDDSIPWVKSKLGIV